MGEIIYIEVKDDEPWQKPPYLVSLVLKVISAIIPMANPDFEKLYPEVRVWLLEVALPEGLPQREVGLNKSRDPIVAGPIGNNYGFWVDGPEPVKWEDYPKVEPLLFKESWEKVAQKLQDKPKR